MIRMKRLHIPPALALFIMAPVFGELFSGSTPLNEFINPIVFLIQALLYGCGAIIIRELVIRWEKGWGSLLLLGIAYGIYEEGLVVRSFFDPNWVDLGNLGVYGRVAGVNWVWSEHLAIYHALVSIAASIALVEILYASQRRDSWTPTRRWWLANWTGLLLMLPIGKLLTPYDAPDRWVFLTWLSIFSLVGLARMLPAHILPYREVRVPKPWVFFSIGFIGMFGQFLLIYNGSDNHAYPFPAAMLLVLIYDFFMLWLINYWNGNGAVWNDRHKIALINGVMSFFLVLGPLTTNGQYPIMYFSNPVFLIFLWLAARKVKNRPHLIPGDMGISHHLVPRP